MELTDYKFWIADYDRARKHNHDCPELSEIFNFPGSMWFGVKQKKNRNITKRVTRLLNRADPYDPVLVLYNIPDRDIGQHSKGGADSEADYLEFMTEFATAIGDRSPIVIYEPDALPHSTLMSKDAALRRYSLMRQGVKILTEKSRSLVYIDIGHSNWLSPLDAATLLNNVASPGVRGFSVNVSNYRTTEEAMRWAMKVKDFTPYKYFVIDTSRNGNGPLNDEWCNPRGRALGHPPTVHTGEHYCDAFLWIKVPGESDGYCNGGPAAGMFWKEYAEELVKNSPWFTAKLGDYSLHNEIEN